MITTTGPNQGDNRPSAAALVFFLVLLGGVTLLAVIDRIHHLGHATGNICFAAVPLMAALAATYRLSRDHKQNEAVRPPRPRIMSSPTRTLRAAEPITRKSDGRHRGHTCTAHGAAAPIAQPDHRQIR